jgi:recombination protein RecT
MTTTTQLTPKQQNELSRQQHIKAIKTQVFDRVQSTITNYSNTGEINLPADYSPGNALKSAFLILQDTVNKDKRPVLEACSQLSIHNALYSMVVQGLNPEKKQCYFIAYGDKLTLSRSYFGTVALAKRLDPSIEDVTAEVIYKGDELKYSIINGRKVISEHVQKFMTEDDNPQIIGAYAIVVNRYGVVTATEIMTIRQIHQSWRMSRQNPFTDTGTLKPDTVHAKFTEEMCKRTVLNKVCKPIINNSSDATLLNAILEDSDPIDVRGQRYLEAANSIDAPIDMRNAGSQLPKEEEWEPVIAPDLPPVGEYEQNDGASHQEPPPPDEPPQIKPPVSL